MEDMNIDIDPNTGLPQLPEGYFWKVRQTVFGDGKAKSPGVLQIVTLEKKWYNEVYVTPRSNFTGETRTVKETRKIEDFFGVDIPYGRTNVTEYLHDVSTNLWSEWFEPNFDWKPQSLLQVAFTAYEGFFSQHTEAERIKSMVGIYPPKKREEEDNSHLYGHFPRRVDE